MTVSCQSRQKGRIAFLFSIILTIAVIFTGCDSSGGSDSSGENGADGSGTSGNGGLVYMGETIPLTQLSFVKFGLYGSAYNTEIFIKSDEISLNTGTGISIYLDTFFNTSEVTAGEYSWTVDGETPVASTFSDSSDIITVVNGAVTSSDQITGGSFFISLSGESTYNITGTVTTSKGIATFIYDGPVNFVLEE